MISALLAVPGVVQPIDTAIDTVVAEMRMMALLMHGLLLMDVRRHKPANTTSTAAWCIARHTEPHTHAHVHAHVHVHAHAEMAETLMWDVMVHTQVGRSWSGGSGPWAEVAGVESVEVEPSTAAVCSEPKVCKKLTSKGCGGGGLDRNGQGRNRDGGPYVAPCGDGPLVEALVVVEVDGGQMDEACVVVMGKMESWRKKGMAGCLE
ncbi:hypothetical protein WICPIJ_008048 [Wickerhamomyces pijperi]|uniref:Uncharacterized protein n=1 Tax=Wickerhamomyces pijperi TaxID=599730 RepID=A0A9P8PZ05_WICPI|nr:hypothetical protein WICPIJ_008048 [Wickerhamomyces pijperi]